MNFNNINIFRKFGQTYLPIILISIYAFFINWVSANMGVMVIDTFSFFDSSFSIFKNKLPLRDFWAFTGIFVDYAQAFFFLIFGKSWTSYVIHACFFNILVSLIFYYFLQQLEVSKLYSFFYTISFATLCYPVSGTPFAYLHSFILSLVSIFLICMAIKKDNLIIWFILPIVCFLAFFSMQTPSAYIILIIIFFSLYFLLKKNYFKSFKYFLYGGFFAIIILFLYLFLTKTPFENLLFQYFLFPLSLGSERILSDPAAYVSLKEQVSIKKLIMDFKYIHIFLLPIIVLTIKQFYTKDQNKLKIYNLIIILSTFAFLFNQLVTANQIYIFCLIPILASVLHFNIEKKRYNKYFKFLIILLICFITSKYHLRYNIDRKFLDLENTNKGNAQNAEILDVKMKNLKWINPYHEPKEELLFLKNSIEHLKKDKRKKTLITHYHFISTILEEDLNILNRWYLFGNDTHPTETHKYFSFYKNMVNKNIKDNQVQVIYLLSQQDEILFENIKNYFTEKCFESKTIVENRFSSHEIIKCNK